MRPKKNKMFVLKIKKIWLILVNFRNQQQQYLKISRLNGDGSSMAVTGKVCYKDCQFTIDTISCETVVRVTTLSSHGTKRDLKQLMESQFLSKEYTKSNFRIVYIHLTLKFT